MGISMNRDVIIEYIRDCASTLNRNPERFKQAESVVKFLADMERILLRKPDLSEADLMQCKRRVDNKIKNAR